MKYRLKDLLLPLMLWVFTFTIAHGQSKSALDSLYNLSSSYKNRDTVLVNIFNDLAWELSSVDLMKAEYYAKEALRLSDSLVYKRGKITSQNRIGGIAIRRKDYDFADSLYQEILKSEREEKYDYGIGRALIYLGTIKKNTSQLQKALAYYEEAYTIFKKIKDKKSQCMVLNNIGSAYRKLGKYEEALTCYINCITIRKEINDVKGLANAYLSMGNFYYDIDSYNKAIEYLKKSERLFLELGNKHGLAKATNNIGVIYFMLSNYNEAKKYYTDTLRLYELLGTSQNNPDIYNNLGTICFEQGLFQEASKYYEKALEISKSYGDDETIVEIYYNIGLLKYETKAYLEAIKYFEVGLAKAKLIESPTLMININEYLFKSHYNLKNYIKANSYNKQFLVLKDSIETSFKNVIRQNAKYEKEQLKQLFELNRIKAENKQKRTINIALSVLLGLLSLLFFAIYRIRIESKNRKIAIQQVSALLNNQELKTTHAMIEGQETERERIAKDLHDRLGGMLSAVKIHFKFVEKQLDNLKIENLKRYKQANKLLDEVCDAVRKISHDMASGVLSKFGLVTALEDLQTILNSSVGLELDIHGLSEEERLPLKLEKTLYKINLELIKNAIKHAKPKLITIQLFKRKNEVELCVVDDGIGFDPNIVKSSGVGLKNIKSRVNAEGGVINIDSSLGHGTTIIINIPIKNYKL